MIAATLVLLLQGSQPAASTKGAMLYRRCIACHALEPGGNSPAGPTLHNIVGRRVAAEPGFHYSPALQRFAERHPRWTPQALSLFLVDPLAAVPGTHMGFAGLADPAERRTLIRWLADPQRPAD